MVMVLPQIILDFMAMVHGGGWFSSIAADWNASLTRGLFEPTVQA
jgi:hypothetical protein